MAGVRERVSRIQRPWSVYRANTFELSNEMIGLALAGEGKFVLYRGLLKGLTEPDKMTKSIDLKSGAASLLTT